VKENFVKTTMYAGKPNNSHMKIHEKQNRDGELTEERKQELRDLFECRYGRELSDRELWEIHFNLKRFFIAISKVD